MKNYIERDLEKEIKKYLKSREILAVVGPRRSGKTTLVESILKSQKRKINRISFDNVKILRLFEEDIDAFIDEHIKDYELVFIDEVQYSKDSGKKLKYIYDTNWTKIIISGSSAAEISIHRLKYLVGRIFTFNLYPFSFREYLRAKEKSLEKYLGEKKVSNIILERLNLHLENYLIYGGYPQVVLSEIDDKRRKVLDSILNTYLLKEIREILNLGDDYKLMDLMKALSLQIGNILNYNEISKITGFSYLDLKRYLNILEKTFVIKQVRPYFTNKRTEIVKAPKIYFYDLGFRNAVLNNFERERTEIGSIYENFVFSELMIRGVEPKYWNTKSNAEVDFVLEMKGKLFPVEVKLNLIGKRLTKSFRSFLEKYPSEKGYFLSKSFLGTLSEKNTSIYFLPVVFVESLV